MITKIKNLWKENIHENFIGILLESIKNIIMTFNINPIELNLLPNIFL